MALLPMAIRALIAVIAVALLVTAPARARRDEANRADDLRGVQAWVAARVDVKAKLSNGTTALIVGAQNDHEDAVRALVAAKAEVRALIDAKAEIETRQADGPTALSQAWQSAYRDECAS